MEAQDYNYSEPQLQPRILFHYWLSPASRALRLILAEKGIPFELQLEKPWERRPGFMRLSPTGDIPVLIEPDGFAMSEPRSICEYFDDGHEDTPFLGMTQKARCEVRRLMGWFEVKFQHEVISHLIGEKVYKRFAREGAPKSENIRAGKANLENHLQYMSYLLEQNNWLAGDFYSYADMIAAAYLSTLDYLGDIDWKAFEEVKYWYVKIKSRPSFRPLLEDKVPSLSATPHYADLDF